MTKDWVLPRWAQGRKPQRGALKWVRMPDWAKRHKVLSTLGFVFFLGLGSFVWLWLTVNLPKNPIPQAQTSFFYDMNGNLITRLPSAQDRRVVKLDAMSPRMLTATIAVEDRGFYGHGAIDVRSTVRAFWVDLRYGGVYQGGSTITQQLVKNVYTGSHRNLIRKVKEAVLAVKLESQKSKSEILELYLNTVYFGRGAYGVQAASQVYFHKDAKDLDWPQAAFLAGLIREPSSGDPADDPSAAADARDRALDALVETGELSAEEAFLYESQRIEICAAGKSDADRLCVDEWDRSGIELTGSTAYFLEYVRQKLEEKYGQRLYTGGFKIYTTLDPRLQEEARRVVEETLDREDDPAAALVAVDTTGAVRAMYGGGDFAKSQVNLAVGLEGGGSGRQGGSTFKPFVLAAAIEEGISLDSVLPGWSPREVDFDEETVKVWNYGNSQYGGLTVTDATVRSVNTAYATLGGRVGLERVLDEARDLGIRGALPKSPRVVLGLAEVSPLDMANAYCTFASRGERSEIRVVTKIVGPDGKVVDEFPVKRTRVMKQNDADQVNWVLRQVISRGTGGAAWIGRHAAGKTGTHDENTNAWFVGYTPEQICTAVWMGYPETNNKPMNNVHGVRVDGGTFPARMWGAFMDAATQPLAATRFVEPDFTGKVEYIGGARRSYPVEEAAEETTTSSAPDGSSTTDPATSTSRPFPATTPGAPPTVTMAPTSTTSTTAPQSGPTLPLPTGPAETEPEEPPASQQGGTTTTASSDSTTTTR